MNLRLLQGFGCKNKIPPFIIQVDPDSPGKKGRIPEKKTFNLQFVQLWWNFGDTASEKNFSGENWKTVSFNRNGPRQSESRSRDASSDFSRRSLTIGLARKIAPKIGFFFKLCCIHLSVTDLNRTSFLNLRFFFQCSLHFRKSRKSSHVPVASVPAGIRELRFARPGDSDGSVLD